MTSLFSPPQHTRHPLPLLMGIVNVTPDSFFDGGQLANADAAIKHGLALRDQGADIIDVGGESTRPGADPVGVEDELARVLPVVQGLVQAGVVVSVDTRHAEVMAAALQVGAQIINDVAALTHSPDALEIIVKHQAHVVLMHMQNNPQTMQQAPHYQDVVAEVVGFLQQRATACITAGLPANRIALCPGIGFGKSLTHNLTLLQQFHQLVATGFPIMLGASRKSFVAGVSRNEPPADRLPGSLAAALWATSQGARLLRVHDIAATHQALAVWQAIQAGQFG